MGSCGPEAAPRTRLEVLAAAWETPARPAWISIYVSLTNTVAAACIPPKYELSHRFVLNMISLFVMQLAGEQLTPRPLNDIEFED